MSNSQFTRAPITETGMLISRPVERSIRSDFQPEILVKGGERLEAGRCVQWKPPRSILEIGDVALAYSAPGDPKRPVILLLGWPFSRSIFDGVVEDLSDDAFVLAFDLPEIGGSRGAPPSAEKHVLGELALAAAESLGANSILIAGIDVGGMIRLRGRTRPWRVSSAPR